MATSLVDMRPLRWPKRPLLPRTGRRGPCPLGRLIAIPLSSAAPHPCPAPWLQRHVTGHPGLHPQSGSGPAGGRARCARPRVEQTQAGAIRGSPGHEDAAASIDQALRADQVIGNGAALQSRLAPIGVRLPPASKGSGCNVCSSPTTSSLIQCVPSNSRAMWARVMASRAAAACRVGQQVSATLAGGVADDLNKAVVATARHSQGALEPPGQHLGARGLDGLRRVSGEG